MDLVEEYAREYLKDCGPYTQIDLDKIAQEQFNRNAASNKATILDTEMLVMRIWCEEKFGACSDVIESLFVQQNIDIYFLCKPDFKWHPDPLRESPNENKRKLIFELFEKKMSNRNLNYYVIDGNLTKRLKTCIDIIHKMR